MVDSALVTHNNAFQESGVIFTPFVKNFSVRCTSCAAKYLIPKCCKNLICAHCRDAMNRSLLSENLFFLMKAMNIICLTQIAHWGKVCCNWKRKCYRYIFTYERCELNQRNNITEYYPCIS